MMISTTKPDDGPEFPDTQAHPVINLHVEMLRDYFAAKAMQGILTGHFAFYGQKKYFDRKEVSSEAYEIADAMLKARAL